MKRFFFITAAVLMLLPGLMQAKTLSESVTGNLGASGNKAGFTNAKDPREIVADVIQIALQFTGTIMIALIVYGGFLYITSQGEEEKIEKGKKIISGSVIGLVIILSAYSIVYFVSRRIQNAVRQDGEKVYQIDDSSFTNY